MGSSLSGLRGNLLVAETCRRLIEGVLHVKIGIIHLSDIHFHKGSFDRDADKKTAERICAAVKTELIGSTHVLLIVSGDIAFSGLEEEYQYALDWFSELYTLVDDACEATCWILCAPGNHDVDLTENRPIRAALISQISKNPTFCTDEGIIYECTKEQTAFFNFRSEVESDKVLVSDDPLLRIHRIRGGVNEVQINILNSAWMSSLDQTPHSIIYPIDRYSEQFRTSKGFVITVLHHPLSWFEVENSRKLCHEISQSSSVVFCGHEHMPASTRILTSFGDHVKFLDGGVLNSHDPLRRSSFNLLLLDADACKLKDFKFEQIGDRYKSKRETDWQDATRLATAESRQFRLRKQVRSEIEGVGINIIHPRRDQLLLRDLFIYPDLLPIDEKESAAYKRLERTVSSERLVFESGSSHVILEGDEKTGKTALLRMLFSDFYGRGKIPLYVLGSKINTRDDRSIRESLRRAFERTYEGVDFTRYEQIGSSDRVILLDDFGQLEKNLRAHQLILEFLRQFSDKVIITTRDPLPLEWLTSGEKRSAVFQKYNSYVIQKFGHVKRNELIERWLFLDRQNEEITSILDERNHARQVIDTTIGQNFVPPSPIFVLVILQSIETASSSNVGSTYGHYYQFLIVQSLMHSGIRPEDLDAVSNFISELAYNAFFLNKTRRISEDTFVCFHQKFRSEYGIDWNLGRIRYMLQKGNIIAIEAAGSITFKYRYIFYFYLAKRLSRGLSENDICGTVRHMCNRLHVTEYANVILFLIHHSDDKFVLDSLQTAASLLMQEQRSFEFEAGDKLLEMVNQLPSPTPIGLQLLEDRDPEKEQKRALKNQDVIEAETEEIEEHISDEMAFEHEPMDALDILAQGRCGCENSRLTWTGFKELLWIVTN